MFDGAPLLDDLLLDVATTIELSDRDRRVANTRYRELKRHLERPTSVLARLLAQPGSLIYPQGSAATGTTIVGGERDDRFDLDAIVECRVPLDWSPGKVLDQLHIALQGFPDVHEIERCTRCVQLRFAFMHLDVTVLDPAAEPRQPRGGEIFHAPESGLSYRAFANPYGFALWFRSRMEENVEFQKAILARRLAAGVDRLVGKAAEQEDLPEIIPPRADTQRVVALKLLKRFTKGRFEKRDVRVPPSIYLAYFAATGFELDSGLCAQLEDLAQRLEDDLCSNIRAATTPDHRVNGDRLNDRWPANASDMTLYADDLEYLRRQLSRARTSVFADVRKIFADLFGEGVGARSADLFLKRAESADAASTRVATGSGAVVSAASVAAPAIQRVTRPVPTHAFHSSVLRTRR